MSDATTTPAGWKGWATQGAPSSATPAGWRGWAAQGAPSPAPPAGWRGWAAHGAPSPAPPAGWRGWAAHGAPSPAAPAGWLGWAAHTPTNLLLSVLLPPTQAAADTYVPLTLTLDAPGPGPAEQHTLAYVAPGRYALSVPPGVPLTLALASPRYEASSQIFIVAPGATQELSIQLAFRAGQVPATKVRRRYLFTQLIFLLAYVTAHLASVN